MHKKTQNVLTVGCGYIGCQVAKAELAGGNQVTAWVRSGSKRRALPDIAATLKILPRNLDQTVQPLYPLAGEEPDLIYYFVPPAPEGESDLRVCHFLDALGSLPVAPRVVLISTTSVYGDCGGELVDESRPVNPESDRAKRRLSVEIQWRAWAERNRAALCILRVAGIYGAGKLPLQRLRNHEPVLRLEDSPWSNRVYASDLVRVCMAAGHGNMSGIYNVVDGNPSSMTDYFFRLSDAAGITRPAQISLHEAENRLSAGMLSYLRESKRLSNQRLLKDFGEDIIRFPTLQLGLEDIFNPNPGKGSG